MADIEYWSIPEILWNTNFITLLKIGSLWQRKSLATSNSLIKIPSELWTQTRRALVFRWNEKWTREGECKWAILNISESIINQLVFFLWYSRSVSLSNTCKFWFISQRSRRNPVTCIDLACRSNQMWQWQKSILIGITRPYPELCLKRHVLKNKYRNKKILRSNTNMNL